MHAHAEKETTTPHRLNSADALERAFTFADLSAYSWKQRLMIRSADLTFFALIKLIGGSVRWQVTGQEYWEAASRNGRHPIYTFWHNQVFLGTSFFQQRRIVVMTSRSFDGEYIARFIQRFGYGAARGSSTRGSTGAMVQLVRLMRAGCPAGFAIDGPRGPLHVAKMGAILLAKKTGEPILPLTLTPRTYWTVNSWDRFQVPLPFTSALVQFAAPIYVATDADEPELDARRAELQETLDELTRRGEKWRARL